MANIGGWRWCTRVGILYSNQSYTRMGSLSVSALKKKTGRK